MHMTTKGDNVWPKRACGDKMCCTTGLQVRTVRRLLLEVPQTLLESQEELKHLKHTKSSLRSQEELHHKTQVPESKPQKRRSDETSIQDCKNKDGTRPNGLQIIKGADNEL